MTAWVLVYFISMFSYSTVSGIESEAECRALSEKMKALGAVNEGKHAKSRFVLKNKIAT